MNLYGKAWKILGYKLVTSFWSEDSKNEETGKVGKDCLKGS